VEFQDNEAFDQMGNDQIFQEGHYPMDLRNQKVHRWDMDVRITVFIGSEVTLGDMDIYNTRRHICRWDAAPYSLIHTGRRFREASIMLMTEAVIPCKNVGQYLLDQTVLITEDSQVVFTYVAVRTCDLT
jgi:hypothetical protein